MSNANVNCEPRAKSSPTLRTSNVRQLIRMFEQLTIYGVHTAPPSVVRADIELPKQASTAGKAITLLVNGRLVAQSMPHKRDSSERAKGLDAN